MTKLKEDISTVLRNIKDDITEETWISRVRYFNQMLELASKLHITEPCQRLYDEFIADDHNSRERKSLHIRCVKLLDFIAKTHAKDVNGNYFNETTFPNKSETNKYFADKIFPIRDDISIYYLVAKSEIEMEYLHQSKSTIGQYKHAWRDICRFFENLSQTNFNKAIIQSYLEENLEMLHLNERKMWKWKINRKAALVLIEIAQKGSFKWCAVSRYIAISEAELEQLRLTYRKHIKSKNLCDNTVALYDYVFRCFIESSNVRTLTELYILSPESIVDVTSSFSRKCNSNSMRTVLPILRNILKELFTQDLIKKDLSGMIIKPNCSRGSVTVYLNESDIKVLVKALEKDSKRNRAIILLALSYGIRDSDITSLRFDEIDWKNDKIILNQKKTKKSLILPLLPEVGNALMDYILNERPKVSKDYPYIFLRTQAPHIKLTSMYPLCSKLLHKINAIPVNGENYGIHLFRYTLVNRMLKAKIPHQVITDTLGHASKDSQKSYLSMEVSMLRQCSLDLSMIGTPSWVVFKW